MDPKPFLDFAASLVGWAGWLALAGVVIAVVGFVLDIFLKPKPDPHAESASPTLGSVLLQLIRGSFKLIAAPSTRPALRLAAFGMILVYIAVAMLVLSIIPAVIGWFGTMADGGGGASNSPSPSSST